MILEINIIWFIIWIWLAFLLGILFMCIWIYRGEIEVGYLNEEEKKALLEGNEYVKNKLAEGSRENYHRRLKEEKK